MSNLFYQGPGVTATRMDELEETFAGNDSDDVGVQSYPGCPVTHLDLPEVQNLAAKFVYNYYVRDERTNARGTTIVFDTSSALDESPYNQYILNNPVPPRQVRITISTKDFTGFYTDEGTEQAIISTEAFLESLGSNPIKTHYDSIISEDTIASGYFSAAHLKDDYIDKQFYNEISSSVSFFGSDVNTIGTAGLEEMGVDTTPILSNGNQIRKSLKNIQSRGISFAPTDVRREISDDAFTSVANLDFAMTFNNKMIGSSIDYSLTEKINIYDNELESLRQDAIDIQMRAIASDNPGVIMSDEFDFGVPSIMTEVVNDAPLQGGMVVKGDFAGDSPKGGNPEPAEPTDDSRVRVGERSVPIGYIVEKFEITQADDGDFKKTELPPLIIEGFRASIDVHDTDVKYGATYIYRAKIVTATRFETLRISSEDDMGVGMPDQVVMATMLLKSSGVSVKVDCIENIPPNPPQNLRFHWDYQNDELVLFWEEALNKQRDVVRYQIFKRSSVDVPFTLVKELDFDHSTSKVVPVEKAPTKLVQKLPGPRKSYRDKEFTKNSKKIYAICGGDARGFTSNYSMQYMVSFDTSRNKLKVDVISRSGAPKPYPNVYLRNDLFVDTMRASGLNRMRIFFDPEAFDITKSTLTGGKYYNASQKFISEDYKIQIINVDSQLSKVINISVKDDTGTPVEMTAGTAESSFTRGF